MKALLCFVSFLRLLDLLTCLFVDGIKRRPRAIESLLSLLSFLSPHLHPLPTNRAPTSSNGQNFLSFLLGIQRFALELLVSNLFDDKILVFGPEQPVI